MLPQIIGPGTFPPTPTASTASARAEQGAQPSGGETGAANARPETTNRVDPPRVLPAPIPLPEDEKWRGPVLARQALMPADPDAPAGPPPAFDATPLERERERLMAVSELKRPPDPPSDVSEEIAAPEANASRSLDGETEASEEAWAGRADPAAEAREKVEAEVAEVRRMAEPEPERGLDLVR
jgi:hypothetical protein